MEAPLSLPEFKTLLKGEVYTIDFLAHRYLDRYNPDQNILRRGFLVLGRYKHPAFREVVAYLQQAAYFPTVAENLDGKVSKLVSSLPEEYKRELQKGESARFVETIISIGIDRQKNQQQWLEVEYFTLPSPLCIEQAEHMQEPEWYHGASRDESLIKQGLQRWFLIRMPYRFLSQPEKIAPKIEESSLSDKEGTIYVINNICEVFSPPEHFAQIEDISYWKIKQAGLETMMKIQPDGSALQTVTDIDKKVILLN